MADITSIAPQYLEVWRRGASEELNLTFRSKHTAIRFTYRLHEARRALRKAEHPLAKIANGVSCSRPREQEDGTWLVTVGPKDADVFEDLEAQGILGNNPYSPQE